MEMFDKQGMHADDPRNKPKRGTQAILDEGPVKAEAHEFLLLQWPDQGREEEIVYRDLGKSEYYGARPKKHGHEKEVLAFEDRITGKPLIFRGFNLRLLRQEIRDQIHKELAPVERGTNIRELINQNEWVITAIEMPSLITLAAVNQAEPGFLAFIDPNAETDSSAIHTLH